MMKYYVPIKKNKNPGYGGNSRIYYMKKARYQKVYTEYNIFSNKEGNLGLYIGNCLITEGNQER